MVAVEAVIIEVLFCNNASMRYIFKRREPANLPAQAPTKYQLAIDLKTRQSTRINSSIMAARAWRRNLPMLLPFRSDGQLASWAAFHESCSV
jgi:hypothetical protein